MRASVRECVCTCVLKSGDGGGASRRGRQSAVGRVGGVTNAVGGWGRIVCVVCVCGVCVFVCGVRVYEKQLAKRGGGMSKRSWAQKKAKRDCVWRARPPRPPPRKEFSGGEGQAGGPQPKGETCGLRGAREGETEERLCLCVCERKGGGGWGCGWPLSSRRRLTMLCGRALPPAGRGRGEGGGKVGWRFKGWVVKRCGRVTVRWGRRKGGGKDCVTRSSVAGLHVCARVRLGCGLW